MKIVLGVFLLLLVASCAQVQQEDTIKIGVILPLSGSSSSIGTTLLEGFQWKVEQLQDQGYNIELHIEDTGSETKNAVSAFNKLVSVDGINIIYTTRSPTGLALKPLAEKEKVLLWVDASHPEITQNTTYVVRHADLAVNNVNDFIDHIKNKEYSSISIIYQQDDWGSIHHDLIKNNVQDIKIESYAIDAKNADFRSELTKAKDTDALFLFAIGPAASVLIEQARQLNYKGDIISSLGLMLSPGAVESVKPHLTGTYYQTFDTENDFSENYINKFNKTPALISFMGYSDAEFLFRAIEETQSQDPYDLASYFKKEQTLEGTYETVSVLEDGDLIIPTTLKKWG